MLIEDEFIAIARTHTSIALVPLSIKSSFVTTPKVLSPENGKGCEKKEKKLARLPWHDNDKRYIYNSCFMQSRFEMLQEQNSNCTCRIHVLSKLDSI